MASYSLLSLSTVVASSALGALAEGHFPGQNHSAGQLQQTQLFGLFTAHTDPNCETPAVFSVSKLLNDCIEDGAGRKATGLSWSCDANELNLTYWNPDSKCTTFWETNQRIPFKCTQAPNNFYPGYYLKGNCNATSDQIQASIPKPRVRLDAWEHGSQCSAPTQSIILLSEPATEGRSCIDNFRFKKTAVGLNVSSYDFAGCDSFLSTEEFPYGACTLNDLDVYWQPVAPREWE